MKHVATLNETWSVHQDSMNWVLRRHGTRNPVDSYYGNLHQLAKAMIEREIKKAESFEELERLVNLAATNLAAFINETGTINPKLFTGEPESVKKKRKA